MEFERLLEIVGDDPVFESSLLMAGEARPEQVRLQLSRWTKAGRLYQLRRGLYALAPPYQRTRPHPFCVANRMTRASFVSCQSALAFYGMIPDYVPATASVTTRRPGRWNTPLGVFEFRHIKPGLFRNYRATDLGGRQQAFIAIPEKALLDLAYLEPGSDSPGYVRELRLQNLEQLNMDILRGIAQEIGIPKMQRFAEQIVRLAESQAEEYENL